MNIPMRWTNAAGALAAAAAAVSLAAAPAASAAPVRTATTTNYSTATYLQHALGLPASDAAPAIEPVTYDRFQWLLQQPGNAAVLIGDPALDPTFAARAQDVEAAAQAAGAKKVFWFDPNLSGSAVVGSRTEPALDIRDPASITRLDSGSRAKYDDAWKALVGQYLGNGLNVVQNGLNSESATVTVTNDAAKANDTGHAKVGATGPGTEYLYAYSGGTAPASVGDSFFFIYNKDHVDGGQPAKVVKWTDLTTQAGSTAAQAAVTSAIGAVGASQLSASDQFAFWKSEVNAKQTEQGDTVAQGVNHPVLGDGDAADGWRIDQITYPELVDLLKSGADTANAVILFGGTWCPNTRPVLPAINRYAQQNDVKVYNFDTVLDGGLVGGTTTSASNPLQSRNTANSGGTTNANPSFLYGDLVDAYIKNLKTEYDPAGNSKVTYYPGGDTGGTLTTTRKLQVPFVIGYQKNPAGGVTRQWIIDKGDGTYKEYMSQWWWTNPQPNELNLTTIPALAPIWSKINADLASFTWRTDPATLYPNTGTESDDAQFLVDADTATVTYTAASGQTPASVGVTSAGSNPISISPSALSAALGAVSPAPTSLAGAKTALIAAKTASTPDATLTANLTTIVGAWGVAQQRKTKLITTWGTATAPGSVAGGAAAVHALDVFFGGLPGGVLSRRTVTADAVTAGTAPTIAIKIDNDYGRVPAGDVALVVRQGGTTVATASRAVAQGAASFTLSALPAGSYDYTLSYAGDDQLLGFSETGTLTVRAAEPVGTTTTTTPAPQPAPKGAPAPPSAPKGTVTLPKVKKVAGAVTVRPTSRKGGKYKVTITTAKGAAAPSGKVTIKLKKGKITKTLSGRLSRGVVTVTLPKLAKGTWKVTISWPGDAHYRTASAAGAVIKVTR